MPDISIIIPHRGNALGLWATIHSCAEDLKYSKLTYEFIVVTNGSELSVDQKGLFQFTSSKVGNIHIVDPLSPPDARSTGAEVAEGSALFFFDDHCLVSRDYFRRALLTLDKGGIDVLHGATKFYTDDPAQHHYCLRLDYNFWGSPSPLPVDAAKPYKVAMAGHGAFVMPRESWDKFGGYGPLGLLKGYGGEESLLDFKVWLSGGQVWLDPKLVHYHSPCGKTYQRHFTDDYYKNILKVANVIGGDKWVCKLFDSFVDSSHVRVQSGKSWFDLLVEAQTESAQYADELSTRFVEPLDIFLMSCGERLIAR